MDDGFSKSLPNQRPLPAAHRAATDDVAAFEYNAKEGVRLVGFIWFLKRIAGPLIWFLVLCPVAAFATYGVWAGVISAAIFAVPIYGLLKLTNWQFQKVLGYWTK